MKLFRLCLQLFNFCMLGIKIASETFERLLFKTQAESQLTKTLVPAVLRHLNGQASKKNNIIIISNGIQQKESKPNRKKYAFSQDENAEATSSQLFESRKKKHIIRKQRKQDPDYSVKRQKNDRNVISNIIHHMMKHISTICSQPNFPQFLQKCQSTISAQEFLSIFSEKDQLCKTYITNKHLKILWNQNANKHFCKVMRIMSRVFLCNFSFLTVFYGNKLNKESKDIHYKGRREIIMFLSKLK